MLQVLLNSPSQVSEMLHYLYPASVASVGLFPNAFRILSLSEEDHYILYARGAAISDESS